MMHDAEMLSQESNLRRSYKPNWCAHHTGFGSSSHLSSTNDPVESWLKTCSATENRMKCTSLLSAEFVEAGRKQAITAQMIFDTLTPWCSKSAYGIHVSDICHSCRPAEYEHVMKVVNSSIPWVVLDQPESFPFMYPTAATGILSKTAHPSWAAEVCDRILHKPVAVRMWEKCFGMHTFEPFKDLVQGNLQVVLSGLVLLTLLAVCGFKLCCRGKRSSTEGKS